MSAATELPTWAVYTVSIGTPASALLGVLIGHFLTRRAARELEKRSRREEVMRSLRWAAELAVDQDDRKAQLGVSQLGALAGSDLLDKSQQLFVDAALESVLQPPIDELEEAGEDAEVIQVPLDDDLGLTDEATAVVSSEDDPGEQGGGDDGEEGLRD